MSAHNAKPIHTFLTKKILTNVMVNSGFKLL